MSLPRPRHLVTGATSGVGRATAWRLASEGVSVLIHARSEEKGRPVLEEIRRETGSGRLALVTADFAHLDQVRALAGRIAELAPKLDVLVNNAGLVQERKVLTEDGFELTLQVNHLAPFLLTLLLREPLRRASGRVITVSSGAHRGGTLDEENVGARLRGGGSYRAMRAYADSKLANVLFTRELARREGASGVTAFALHPGVLATGIWDRNDGLLYRVVRLFTRFMGDPERAADAVAHLALDPEPGPSGGYFDRAEPAEPRLPRDPDRVARALWAESLAAVGPLPGGAGAS